MPPICRRQLRSHSGIIHASRAAGPILRTACAAVCAGGRCHPSPRLASQARLPYRSGCNATEWNQSILIGTFSHGSNQHCRESELSSGSWPAAVNAVRTREASDAPSAIRSRSGTPGMSLANRNVRERHILLLGLARSRSLWLASRVRALRSLVTGRSHGRGTQDADAAKTIVSSIWRRISVS